MVKKKIAFVLAVFCATVLLMAVQKPVFLAYYAADAAQASVGEWLGVVWHGLTLDSTVAGYVTALPLLLALVSLWVRLPGRIWRRVLTGYFVLVATATAVIFAVDVELYQHWGFRLDATILIYLTDPEEAMASVDFWLGVRQTLLAVAYAALMVWVYRLVCRLFDGEPLRRRAALPWSLVLLLLAGCDFLAIRGGLGASVANVSKAYFSANMFLNHAATNPVFSFLTSLGDHTDYAAESPLLRRGRTRGTVCPLARERPFRRCSRAGADDLAPQCRGGYSRKFRPYGHGCRCRRSARHAQHAAPEGRRHLVRKFLRQLVPHRPG